MSTATIELKDVGPITRLVIPVPENGGVCVLRARNGKGKTKALEAVESAITGRGKVSVRDGAKHGEVDAFGVSIKVGRSMRRDGELEVSHLDGRLSVAELVDPGLKSDEAADARRIKALVQLANVLPSADLFYPLVGGRENFERLIGTSAMASDDLVLMAERIKRDLEAAARKEESQAEHAQGRARGARDAAAGVDMAAPHDSAVLQTALEDAVREESRLKAQAEGATKAAQLVERAQAQLEDAQSGYTGPSLDDASLAERNAATNLDSARKTRDDLKAALLKAEADLKIAQTAHATAFSARTVAEQHEKMVAQWREQLAAAVPVAPSADHLAEATTRVTTCRQAIEQGAMVRAAKQRLAEAESHAAAAKAHADQAAQLREAAKGTDEVLSEVVAKTGSPLRVEVGRLVLDTIRGVTYFADLSMGERWKLALDIAIDAVGRKGVLTIPQEAYESLDPQNRRLIAEHVAGTGVVILTAEASGDDEIRADIYATDESSS